MVDRFYDLMELDTLTQYMVQSIQGVTKFIGEGNEPHPLRKSEVERLLGVANAEETLPKIEIPYVNGDSVRIKEGPFKDFIGTVEEVNSEKRKLKAMVSDDEKAFVTGLLLIQMYERCESLGASVGGALRHVTVIEEAHRLLRKSGSVFRRSRSNSTMILVEKCRMISS